MKEGKHRPLLSLHFSNGVLACGAARHMARLCAMVQPHSSGRYADVDRGLSAQLPQWVRKVAFHTLPDDRHEPCARGSGGTGLSA